MKLVNVFTVFGLCSTFILMSTSYYMIHENTSVDSGTPLTPVDEEATDCRDLLTRFRSHHIPEIANHPNRTILEQSYTVLTNTPIPFYVSTHNPDYDPVRGSIIPAKNYYERQLTERVIETFQEKLKNEQESIFLDVGANVGWFSLVAAAHGATKVYSFDPNIINTIRFCESLHLNGWLDDNYNYGSINDVASLPTSKGDTPTRRIQVMAITKGAGRENGSLPMYSLGGKASNPGNFGFKKKIGKLIGEKEITTLDSFAERHGWFENRPSIGFFKLDVEFFEAEVLAGATKLLQARLIENICMEMKSGQVDKEKENVLKTFYESGYELYMHGGYRGPNNIVEKKYSDWKDLLEDMKNKKYQDNLLFKLKMI